MRTTLLCILSGLALVAACGGAPDDNNGTSTSSSENSSGMPPEASPLDLPETPYDYANPMLPPTLTNPNAQAHDNTPPNNPVTNDGATLGRVLFYDKTLSANDTVACASCHQQQHAFTDPGQFSEGFAGGFTGRNSMSLMNARFYRNGHFFWDERAVTLEDQVLMPIQNEVEMGLTLTTLLERVKSKEYYPALFEKAFGDSEITTERISLALAQFVRSIVSYQSRYDEGLALAGNPGAQFPNFTVQENQGKALFLGPAGCGRCHLDPGPPPPPPGPPPNQAIFYIDLAVNNGVDQGQPTDDPGVGGITKNPEDNGKFKSPSLRNAAMTAPYMHDGRFKTLDEVVEHYNSGVKMHPNLDPRLLEPNVMPPQPRKLNLTPEQKAALVAFLGTLTDDEVMKDPKYSDPFIP
jgi:cytochrome c peroxidase